MTKEEITERLERLYYTGQLTLFKGRFFDTENPTPVSSINDLKDFDNLTLWVNNNYYKPNCLSKGQGAYESKFLFDYFKDPVIELENCKIDNKLISPGRLYYKSGWIGNPELRQVHKRMSDKVVRLFGKNLTTISPPFKVSKEIKKLIFEGYEIELGVGGMRMTKSNINGT